MDKNATAINKNFLVLINSPNKYLKYTFKTMISSFLLQKMYNGVLGGPLGEGVAEDAGGWRLKAAMTMQLQRGGGLPLFAYRKLENSP